MWWETVSGFWRGELTRLCCPSQQDDGCRERTPEPRGAGIEPWLLVILRCDDAADYIYIWSRIDLWRTWNYIVSPHGAVGWLTDHHWQMRHWTPWQDVYQHVLQSHSFTKFMVIFFNGLNMTDLIVKTNMSSGSEHWQLCIHDCDRL